VVISDSDEEPAPTRPRRRRSSSPPLPPVPPDDPSVSSGGPEAGELDPQSGPAKSVADEGGSKVDFLVYVFSSGIILQV